MAETKTPSPAAAGKAVAIPSAIVIKDLATLLELPVNKVIMELMKNGIMSSMNERIDYDTAAVIASDFGFTTTKKEGGEDDRQKTINEELGDLLGKDDTKHLKTRPPVVVVMGHVDHGKTKLLDAIRETNVMGGEAGGITQHIGAYQVEKKGRPITFVDTPGHEAFTAMRSRGAHVADIAILVVAADDGFKPQTDEALKIIQQADIPFIVAINKIDKADANPEKVKQQLAERNLLTEDWGGKLTAVPVSAEKGTGIDTLLETILLIADVEEEQMQADPKRPAVGSVVESHIDAGEGPVATVIIRTGTLKRGDQIKIGNTAGKVKALKDWHGAMIAHATPSMPAKILGLKRAPEVGDILMAIGETEAKQLRRTQKVKTERSKTRVVYQIKQDEEEQPKEQPAARPVLNIVLRSDNLGSEEAILEHLQRYERSAVGVEVVAKGLGNITEADVERAATAGAVLYGFHVVPTKSAQDVARGQQMAFRTFDVIYDLFDNIRGELDALLPVERIITELGQLTVLAIFRKEKKAMIVGGKVTAGVARTGVRAKVLREGVEIADGLLTQVQQEKTKVDQVAKGQEAGVRFEGKPVIQEGDTLAIYSAEERKATL